MVSSTKDAFVRKVEVKLNRSKSGKETIKGGYHTEQEMRTELKIPELHGSVSCYMFLHALHETVPVSNPQSSLEAGSGTESRPSRSTVFDERRSTPGPFWRARVGL